MNLPIPGITMTDAKLIEEAVARLLKAAPPGSQVILFGSQARGTADARSDVDLMVVEPSVKNRHAESVRLRRALEPLPGGFDIVVTSYEGFDYWRDTPNTLYYRVAKEGRVYGAQR
jgi:predicted nucleotidyltransferase